MTDRTAKLVTRAAERAATRPEYLGWVLTRYMESEALEWLTVAAMLKTSEPFARLALCLRPRPERFAGDVNAIGEKFTLDGAALGQIVRFVDALHAMADGEHGDTSHRGTLLAARRKREKDDGSGRSH
ncbi:MAG: hypothetical protein ACREON_12205 [Gemmatimonadaceae bacterium]